MAPMADGVPLNGTQGWREASGRLIDRKDTERSAPGVPGTVLKVEWACRLTGVVLGQGSDSE